MRGEVPLPPRPATVLPDAEEPAAALLARAARRLARADRRLATLVAEIGPCGLRRRPGGFAGLCRAILGQQLSGKAAATIRARLGLACGGTLTAATLADLDDADFAAAGVSRQKREALRALAAAAAVPDFFAALEGLPDEAVVESLTAIRGVGRWTAEMYLIFSLGRLDVLPLGDLSIRTALGRIYGGSGDLAAMETVAAPWRPYRSVACWYLYACLDRAPAA
jgi:DNA-3-methyladenine glycosylase II